MSDDKKNPPIKTPAEDTRLPCRGCTVNCKSFGFCEGKPWRLNTQGTADNPVIH